MDVGTGTLADIASRLPVVAVMLAALGFLRWLIPFVFARLDVGAAALGRRLSHVEEELDRYREATMLLVNAMAIKDPRNKVLREVARILSTIPPRSSMELDELTNRLNDIPGTGT